MDNKTHKRKTGIAKTTVAGAATVVMAGMIVSRLLGFVRYRTITGIFGSTHETDAFFAAFKLPDLLYILASGGALTAAFIPVFTEYLVNKKEKEAWHVASSIFNFMTLIISALILIGLVCAPLLIGKIVAPGFKAHPETLRLAVTMTRIIFAMVLLTSLSALCNGILHSFNHFHAPAVSWSLHNLGIISFAILLSPRFGIFSLCYGVLAGATTMVLLQLPVVFAKGAEYHPVMDLKHPGVSRILKLFLPAMMGLAITQINLLYFPTLFGSYLGEGTVSALEIAVRILLVPLGLFGSSLSMAIFPALSRYAGNEKKDEFHRTLSRGLIVTFLFSVPSTIFFMLMALPVVRFLFQSRTFTLEDCNATALALKFFALGIAGHTALQVTARGFYALQDTATPFKTGLFSVLFISVPGCLLLTSTPLKHGGIALSISVSTLVNMLILFGILLSRVPGLDLNSFFKTLIKIAISSAAMTAVCLPLKSLLSQNHPGIQVVLNMTASGSVFLISCAVLKVDVMNDILGRIANRFHPRRKTGAKQL